LALLDVKAHRRTAKGSEVGMIDRKKVCKGLYAHGYKDCNSCPYWGSGLHGGSECKELAREALSLLREQEPIKPTLSVDTWICSKCGHTLESQELIDDKENPQVLIHEQYQYCPNCGKAVKWK